MTKSQLKLVFGRTWPDTFRDNNPSFLHDGVYGFNFFHGGHAYASFPSGHTAVTCAVISVLWIYYPAWRRLYALAVLGSRHRADRRQLPFRQRRDRRRLCRRLERLDAHLALEGA